ncbi:DnaB-like helicase N terminal domain protein [Mycobacteroides abscessus subsp. abscessus]|uniref:hypothetical protein n=1 Tax=Mycobacteroides abscessus TaxID=36809 RepID=UPI0009A81726|nr:hypothetical protein [Mycobacteroides abscessus]SLI01001.1 DnaB-like helicase N terminal domain protein [Mycobacteroides abscessus subsp. abscessus]
MIPSHAEPDTSRDSEDLGPLFVWDAEDRLVGELLHMSAAHVRAITALVHPTDIHRPTSRWVYELITQLAADDINPDPRDVMTAARTHTPGEHRYPDAIDIARGRHSEYPVSDIDLAESRPHQFKKLCRYLTDVYTSHTSPFAVITYAREVLELSFRRTNKLWNERGAQMSEAMADRQDIAALHLAMRQDMRDIWNRCEAADAMTTLTARSEGAAQ